MNNQSLTIYLIRHCETVAISRGIIHGGGSDSPLSELGVQQALDLASFFQPIPLQAIYTSPLGRCTETAEALSMKGATPVISERDLMEGSLGEWEGLALEETMRRFEAAGFTKDPFIAPPGGEPLISIRDRVEPFLYRLVQEKTGHIAVVTHGGIIRVMLGVLVGLHREMPWERYPFALDNGSVSVIEMNQGELSSDEARTVIRRVNDTSHLQATPTPESPLATPNA